MVNRIAGELRAKFFNRGARVRPSLKTMLACVWRKNLVSASRPMHSRGLLNAATQQLPLQLPRAIFDAWTTIPPDTHAPGSAVSHQRDEQTRLCQMPHPRPMVL